MMKKDKSTSYFSTKTFDGFGGIVSPGTITSKSLPIKPYENAAGIFDGSYLGIREQQDHRPKSKL